MNKEKIRNAVGGILQGIKPGCVFDSHFVINQLIKHHSDVYLNYACDIKATDGKTRLVHANIGKIIDTFGLRNDLIIQVGDSWSENIHHIPSKCTAWKRK